MSVTGPPIDAARVIADLRELDRRTGGPGGARRVCWGQTWREARGFLGELLAEIGVEPDRDQAGNVWAFVEGDSEPALAVGSHIDSVPGGGWLDGALGVMAGLGVLRAWVQAGERPPQTLALVDWADEEGARFGRSLFGSSAFAGTLDPEAVRDLRDAEGTSLPDALEANGVPLDRVLEAGSRRDALRAYLELHIEQGPVLEAEGVSTAAVNGCAGVERHRFRFEGQASHAGTTPMELRRDAGLAAADAALRIEAIARERDGVATTGVLRLEPGIPTAVPGVAELVADLRHRDAGQLAAMLEDTRRVADDAAGARGCRVSEERDLADRADGLRPPARRAGTGRVPPGLRDRTGADQRRAPRRRRGGADDPDRDGLRLLDRRPQPYRARGHLRGRSGHRDRGLRPAREQCARRRLIVSG